jgi:hypothetical protein
MAVMMRRRWPKIKPLETRFLREGGEGRIPQSPSLRR